MHIVAGSSQGGGEASAQLVENITIMFHIDFSELF